MTENRSAFDTPSPKPLLDAPSLPVGLADLVTRGTHGGRIVAHRAFLRVTIGPFGLVTSISAPFVLCGAWIYFSRVVSAFWSLVFTTGMRLLSMPGRPRIILISFGPVENVPIPFLDVPAAAPNWRIWFFSAIMTVLTALGSLFLRGSRTPVGYFLRAVAALQVTALVFFLFWKFPYGIDDYTIAEMAAGYSLIAIVPLVLGLVYFVFDFHIWQKVGLAVLTMAHLAVFLPVQLLFQAYVIEKFSLLFMPGFFIFFGLPLEVMIAIAFYGWGMSWRGRIRSRDLAEL